MTIFDIVHISNRAFNQAFTPANIKSGFSVTGMEPYNADIFSDDEFLSSSVTDRPVPAADSGVNIDDVDQQPDVSMITVSQEEIIQVASSAGIAAATNVTPEQLRPFPKAGPRKALRGGGRKPQKTRILTDSPEVSRIRTVSAKKVATKSTAGELKFLFVG